MYPEVDHSVFMEYDWSEFNKDAKEAIPINVTEPHGKEVDIHMFMDSNHAGDEVSCKFRSDFLIYLNPALVHWFSKKQPTVETLVFGAEFLP